MSELHNLLKQLDQHLGGNYLSTLHKSHLQTLVTTVKSSSLSESDYCRFGSYFWNKISLKDTSGLNPNEITIIGYIRYVATLLFIKGTPITPSTPFESLLNAVAFQLGTAKTFLAAGQHVMSADILEHAKPSLSALSAASAGIDPGSQFAKTAREHIFTFMVWSAETAWNLDRKPEAVQLVSDASRLPLTDLQARYLSSVLHNLARGDPGEAEGLLRACFDVGKGRLTPKEQAATLRLLASAQLDRLGAEGVSGALSSLDASEQLCPSPKADFLRVRACLAAGEPARARPSLSKLCQDKESDVESAVAACSLCLDEGHLELAYGGLDQLRVSRPFLSVDVQSMWARLLSLVSTRDVNQAHGLVSKLGQERAKGCFEVDDTLCRAFFTLCWSTSISLESKTSTFSKDSLNWLDAARLWLPAVETAQPDMDTVEAQLERQRARLLINSGTEAGLLEARRALTKAASAAERAASRAGSTAPCVHSITRYLELRVFCLLKEEKAAYEALKAMPSAPGFSYGYLAVAAQTAFEAGCQQVSSSALDLLSHENAAVSIGALRALLLVALSSDPSFSSLLGYIRSAREQAASSSSAVSPEECSFFARAAWNTGIIGAQTATDEPATAPSRVLISECFEISAALGEQANRPPLLPDVSGTTDISEQAQPPADPSAVLVPLNKVRAAHVLAATGLLEAAKIYDEPHAPGKEATPDVKQQYFERIQHCCQSIRRIANSQLKLPTDNVFPPADLVTLPDVSAISLSLLIEVEASILLCPGSTPLLVDRIAASPPSHRLVQILTVVSGFCFRGSQPESAAAVARALIASISPSSPPVCSDTGVGEAISVEDIPPALQTARMALQVMTSVTASLSLLRQLLAALRPLSAHCSDDEAHWLVSHSWNRGVTCFQEGEYHNAEAFISLSLSFLAFCDDSRRETMEPVLRGAYGQILESAEKEREMQGETRDAKKLLGIGE